MGRIRTKLIKRISLKLYKENKDKLKKDFNKNKTIVSSIIKFPSKRMRNFVAGYITTLVKHQEKSNQK